MAKLSKKELKALKKAKKDQEEKIRQQIEAERKHKESETQRLYLQNMHTLRDLLPTVLENPWIIVQEEDTGLDFLSAYCLAVRGAKYYHYHLNFPAKISFEEKMAQIEAKWNVTAEQLRQKQEAMAQEEEPAVKKKKTKSKKKKKGTKSKKKGYVEASLEPKQPEIPMPMAEHNKTDEFCFKLRSVPATYIPTQPASKNQGLTLLQELVNVSHECIMQLSTFADSHPCYTFKSPTQINQLVRAARYQAAIENDVYQPKPEEEGDICDGTILETYTTKLQPQWCTSYSHKIMFKVLLNLLKPTLETKEGLKAVLQRIKQTRPSAPTLPKSPAVLTPKPATPKRSGRSSPKSKKSSSRGASKSGRETPKSRSKKNTPRSPLAAKMWAAGISAAEKSAAPLPDIIKSELVDHLLRYATEMYPKEFLREQEEIKLKLKVEEEEKKLEEREGEDGAEEIEKKKKKNRKKRGTEAKEDPSWSRLRISPNVPTMVNALCALKLVLESSPIRNYIAKKSEWKTLKLLTKGEISGFSNPAKILATEVIEMLAGEEENTKVEEGKVATA